MGGRELKSYVIPEQNLVPATLILFSCSSCFSNQALRNILPFCWVRKRQSELALL